MKKFLIHCLDKLDNNILGHRWHGLCQWIADSEWWGDKQCDCHYCERFNK